MSLIYRPNCIMKYNEIGLKFLKEGVFSFFGIRVRKVAFMAPLMNFSFLQNSTISSNSFPKISKEVKKNSSSHPFGHGLLFISKHFKILFTPSKLTSLTKDKRSSLLNKEGKHVKTSNWFPILLSLDLSKDLKSN